MNGFKDELIVVSSEKELTAFASLSVGILFDDRKVFPNIKGCEQVHFLSSKKPTIVFWGMYDNFISEST